MLNCAIRSAYVLLRVTLFSPGMSDFFGRVGSVYGGSCSWDGSMRSQIFACFVLALTIDIQLYYCEAFVRIIAFAVVVCWLILLDNGRP